MFPNGPEAAYYVQSSFVSSDGYGFLLNRDEISHWRLDSDRPDAWQVEAGAPALDYTVVAADAPAGHRAADARSPAASPPRRAGPSALCSTARSSTPLTRPRSTSGGAERPRQHRPLPPPPRRLPHRGLGGASPAAARRATSPQLKARGIHPLLYFRAFVGSDTTGTDDPADYNYAIAHGYVATHADGSPYTFISNFNAAGGDDRLHQSGRGSLVAAAHLRGARPRSRRLHAGLRGAGPRPACTSTTA